MHILGLYPKFKSSSSMSLSKLLNRYPPGWLTSGFILSLYRFQHKYTTTVSWPLTATSGSAVWSSGEDEGVDREEREIKP